MSGNIRTRRKGLVLSTAAGALLAILAGWLLMHRLQIESVQSVRQSVQDWQPVAGGVRTSVILLVALGWNRLLARLARTGKLHPARAGQLATLRWRIVAWLIGLELVLGHGLLVQTVQLVLGSLS